MRTELLLACGVSRTNLLYSGGGHCYILLPNTESVKAALSAWNQRFNAWLSGEFGVSLFLAHGWTECSGNDLTNTPAEDAPTRPCSAAFPPPSPATKCTGTAPTISGG